MAARKIKLKDQLGRVINVPVATQTTAPVTPPATQPDTTRPVATVWKLIREIPQNIQRLAKLLGTGFTTRGADGEWYQRSLAQGEGIAVTNGDGVAGDPAIALAELSNAGGGELVKILRDQYGRVAGTSSAEAPQDGKQYARKDGDWSEMQASVGDHQRMTADGNFRITADGNMRVSR